MAIDLLQERRIQFALKFATLEWLRLNTRQQHAIEFEMWRFLDWPKRDPRDAAFVMPADVDFFRDPIAVVALQHDFMRALGQLADSTVAAKTGDAIGMRDSWIPVTFAFAPRAVRGGTGVHAFIRGATRDRALVALLMLLLTDASDRMMRCPHCRRLFIRIGRAEICGRAGCRRRKTEAYWQRYVKSSKGRAARRRQYETAGNWKLGARGGRR